LNADDAVWDATVFTKNRDRLLEADIAKEFLARVVEQARAKGLTSDEHFTVDGTLLEAWASAKSFQPKDGKPSPPDDPGNPTVNFRGEQRSNETHASKSDSEALLTRKSGGKESKSSYSGSSRFSTAWREHIFRMDVEPRQPHFRPKITLICCFHNSMEQLRGYEIRNSPESWSVRES